MQRFAGYTIFIAVFLVFGNAAKPDNAKDNMMLASAYGGGSSSGGGYGGSSSSYSAPAPAPSYGGAAPAASYGAAPAASYGSAPSSSYGGSSGGPTIPAPPCPKNYVISCQPAMSAVPCSQQSSSGGYGSAAAYSQYVPAYIVPPPHPFGYNY